MVPIKALDRAKSRLAPVMRPADRRTLVLGLLRHTLSVLCDSDDLRAVLVVSADRAVREEAEAYGAAFLCESGAGDLNAALTQAAVEVTHREGQYTTPLRQSMLVIPSDLPLLTRSSVSAVVRSAMPPVQITGPPLHPGEPCMVIAPDRQEAGTNALLVSPPDLIPFCFGPNSFQRHLAAAAAAGMQPVVVRSPALALDLDLPGDLDAAHLSDGTLAERLFALQLQGHRRPPR